MERFHTINRECHYTFCWTPIFLSFNSVLRAAISEYQSKRVLLQLQVQFYNIKSLYSVHKNIIKLKLINVKCKTILSSKGINSVVYVANKNSILTMNNSKKLMKYRTLFKFIFTKRKRSKLHRKVGFTKNFSELFIDLYHRLEGVPSTKYD